MDARGGPFLSLTYISDAVEAILDPTVSGDVGGPAVSMRDLAECIGRVVGREPRFERRDEQATDFIAHHSQFELTTNLDEGIRACARMPAR